MCVLSVSVCACVCVCSECVCVLVCVLCSVHVCVWCLYCMCVGVFMETAILSDAHHSLIPGQLFGQQHTVHHKRV